MKLPLKSDGNLEKIFKRYITPTSVSISTFKEKQEERSTVSQFMSTTKYFRTARPLSRNQKHAIITHGTLLYPSIDTSEEILLHNKKTFNQMSSTLKQIEWSQMKKQDNSIAERKTKLKFFKKRARKSAERGKCTNYYK